jgi:hypothetical protein
MCHSEKAFLHFSNNGRLCGPEAQFYSDHGNILGFLSPAWTIPSLWDTTKHNSLCTVTTVACFERGQKVQGTQV